MSIKKFNAILLAAGLSSRFNSQVPKQYLYLGKKQILDHSIDEIYIQGATTSQLSFSSVNHINGLGALEGVGIYVSGFLEAVYTGGDLSASQLRSMAVGVDA